MRDLLCYIQQLEFTVYIAITVLVSSFIIGGRVAKTSAGRQDAVLRSFLPPFELVRILNIKNDDIVTNAIFLGNEYCGKWGISLGRTRRGNVLPEEVKTRLRTDTQNKK